MTITPPRLNLSTLVAGGVVATVAVVLISFFALRGLFGKLTLNNQVLSKKRAVASQLADNLDALESLGPQYTALGDKKRLIFDALPTTSNFPSIVSSMEQLAKNAGVELTSIEPASTATSASSSKTSDTASSGPILYEFSASIRGGYDSFKSFLRNVELSLRPMAITTMKISGSSDQLGVDMTIVTYYQKEFDTTLKTEPLIKNKASTRGTSTPDLNSTNLNPSSGVSQ